MRFTLTKEIFGGYQHGLSSADAVQSHLSGFRNDLRTIMGQKLEKRFTGHQNYILGCIPEMTARRIAGRTAAVILILVTAFLLVIAIGWRKELDEAHPVFQPLILTLIKQVIPLLVKKTVQVEKYVDAEKAMQATVQRVYFLKMFSLVTIFYNNLKELDNTDASTGLLAISITQKSCVETELGKAYLKLIMMDMVVGAIKEFALYPQWRIKVRIDRNQQIKKTLVAWLAKIGFEDKEAALRKHLEESFFGAKINIEHVREMSIGPEAMNLLKINLNLDAKARLKAPLRPLLQICHGGSKLHVGATGGRNLQAGRASSACLAPFLRELSVLLLTCGLRS